MMTMGRCIGRPGARPRPIAAFVTCVLLCGTLGEWNVSPSRLHVCVYTSMYVGVR